MTIILHASNALASLDKSSGRLAAGILFSAKGTHMRRTLCVNFMIDKSLRGREWLNKEGPMWCSRVILHGDLKLVQCMYKD